MSISTIIKQTCPVCGKIAVEVSRIEFFETKLVTLECGHLLANEKIVGSNYDLTSSDGKSLRPYQVDGIKFLESANGRALIADEQGLGKTIQALGFLKLHSTEALPAVIVTKTTLKHQWFHELARWCGKAGYLAQVISSGKERCMYGFDVYIMSWDMLKIDGMLDDIEPRTLILDEVQAIKDHLSGRGKATQNVSVRFEHIIALSGTPIKNNAGEYFTILNILHPERFSEYNSYIRNYCDSYETMYGYKVGGIADVDRFKEQTSDFIIRRTRAEAAPEIPEVDRQFFHVAMDRKFQGAYDALIKELEELMYSDDEESMPTKIALMTKMYRITGLNKVANCIEFTIEFLLNEPDRKLVIFAHHHDVVAVLEANLNKWLKENNHGPCLNLNAQLSAELRARLVDDFKNRPAARIMIASTLAAGEGLNLQFCSRAIMLERQWNPANEEQAEGRFARIGQTDNIVVTYMIASETIDEYFTELVESKRAIVKSTLDGVSMDWNQSNLMKELVEVLISKGKKKWTL